MRTIVITLALLLAAQARAECPTQAPRSYKMALTAPCGTYEACPNGNVTFEVTPLPTGGFPPAVYDPGYSVQACDTVVWSFGDGTTETVIGSPAVTHSYPDPGNYRVEVTVTNSLGSATVKASTPYVIASSPSRLTITTADVLLPAGTLAPIPEPCTRCVIAHENEEAVVITATRSGDLQRAVSADLKVESTTRTFVFAPNETEKSIVFPIANDTVYSGPRFQPLGLANVRGGALTLENTSWHPTLLVLDDEPVPVISIARSISVREGDDDTKMFEIPVQLSAPMGLDATAEVFYTPDSAGWDDFTACCGLDIPAGQLVGTVVGWIHGDRSPERDERFYVQIAPHSAITDPLFGNSTATVTILNDDAVLSAPPVAVSESSITLTLDVGSPYATPATVRFTSTAGDVVAAPEPVTIPAGATSVKVTTTARRAGTARIDAIVPERTVEPAVVSVVQARRRPSM